ncbi:YdgA family protein [Glaesserella sp.]|uniref:YdgA family protein n=1 Tax=Glaesserella sp. TaxID=2094731 RepID=UPI0035A0165A
MKYSKLVLSLAAVFGGVFIGGSWYSGKLAEEKYQSYIYYANNELGQLLSKFNLDFKVDNIKFERHFFTSDIRYNLVVKDKSIGEGFTLPVESQLYHGPFPLNRIKQFDFTPRMFSAESALVAIEPIKVNFEGGYIANIISDIDYSGELASVKVRTPKKNFVDHNATTSVMAYFQPSEFNLVPAKNGQWALNYHIPQVLLKSENKNAAYPTATIEVNQFSINTLIDEKALLKYHYTAVANAEMKIDSIAFKSDNMFSIENFHTKGENRIVDDKLQSSFSGSMALNGARPQFDPIRFGKITFNSESELDNEAYVKLLDYTYTADLAKSEVMQAELEQLVKNLVTKPIKLTMSPIEFENEKGKNRFDLVLNSSGFSEEQIQNGLQSLPETLQSFNNSKIAIQLNLNSLEELIKQVTLYHSPKPVEAEEQAKQLREMFEMQLQTYAQKNLLVYNQNEVSFSIELKDGKILLNGNERSLEELQQLISNLEEQN